jgi:hypothetical protein
VGTAEKRAQARTRAPVIHWEEGLLRGDRERHDEQSREAERDVDVMENQEDNLHQQRQ